MNEPPLPPPTVTISDPSRPGEPVDVLGSGHEREPWRPGRRTWVVVTVVAVLAAIGVPVSVVQQQHADERAKDRRAVSELKLATTIVQLDTTLEPKEGTTVVGLRNDGPSGLQVLDARVEGAGYGLIDVHQQLDRYAILAVYVPDTRTCSLAVLTDLPTRLVVRLRTLRHQTLTRTVALTPDIGQALSEQTQQRCHYTPTASSLQAFDVDQAIDGRSLTATLNLANTSNLPLRVDRIDAPYGFDLVLDRRLPLALRPEPDESMRQGVAVSARLRVRDCQVFSQAFADGQSFAGVADLSIELTGGTGPAVQVVTGFDDALLLSYARKQCPHDVPTTG